MHKDKHQYITSFNPKEQHQNSDHYDTDFFDRNISSPKKKQIYAQASSKQAIIKTIKTELSKQQNIQSISSGLSLSNIKIKELIVDAISSADRAVKAFLPYGHTQVQKYCSIYFLNKQKLYSFLNNHHLSHVKSQESPSSKKKVKKREQPTSELIQMVPINHLERLEKIVCNKIIPILKIQYEAEKKKSQKLIKKGKESNSDFKEGIKLLERLNQNQKVAVDECAQILQKFIFRMMERQERMMNKLSKLQQKLDDEIKKTEQLLEESKEWEERRGKMEKERKAFYKYQEFAKEIKSIFANSHKINPQTSQKENLQDIIRQIKTIFNQQGKNTPKSDKKCDHKHKQLHGSCKQQQSRNSKQIKNLKQVIKNLNSQNSHLQQECEQLLNKLKTTNDLANKIQLEYKKRTQQNLSMNNKIEEYISQQSYKNKLIQEYLRIIDRLEESIKINQDTVNKLNQENQGYLELITKHSSQKEDYVKHIIDIQQKEKELQEIIAKKEMQIDQVISHLQTKQAELQLHQNTIRHLNALLLQKQQILAANIDQTTKLKQQLNQLQSKDKQAIALQPNLNEQIQIHLQGINQPRNDIAFAKCQNNKQHQILPQQAELRETTMSISSKKYKEFKNKIKNLLKENADLKFQVQRIKTFKALQDYNHQHQNHQLSSQEKHQLKYLRNLIHNYVGKNKKEQNSHNHQEQNPCNQTIGKQQTQRLSLHNNYNATPNALPAYLIVDPIDNPVQQNKKGIERQDFIPAHINKQIIQQKKQFQESPIHRLQDQLQQINQEDIQQPIHEQHNNMFPQLKKVEQEQILQISKQMQIAPIQAEPSKIQQLVDLSERIGQNFIRLKLKFNQSSNLNQGLVQIQKEIDYMTSLLNIYKHNTLKKLQKIKKTELLQKQAQLQIQKLKKRLDDALIANQIQSTIQSNSQDSDFSLPQHLYSFFKHKNPFVAKNYFQSQLDRRIKTKPSKEIYTQTEIPMERRRIPGLSIQSQVIIHHESPLISEVQDMRLINTYQKSFLDQLDAACSPKMESILSGQLKLQTSPVSLQETNNNHNDKEINPQTSLDKVKKETEKKQDKSMGNYNESQVFNLHRLLQQEHIDLILNNTNNELGNITPHRHPFQNSQYMNYISNAPPRRPYHEHQTANNLNYQVQIEQMKHMFMQRQQQLSQMLTQKDQQIQRLKSIIKTLTKTQQIEIKLTTPKTSRHQEYINKQIQSLRSQNENLWTLLIKQKSQIQHLRTMIKQYQVHQQLYKLNHTPHQQFHQENDEYQLINNREIGNNEPFLFYPTHGENKEDIQIDILQLEKETKSQLLQPKQQRQLQLHSHHMNQQPAQKHKNLQQSPKRFTRKTQKFQRQKSPRNRSSKTSPAKTVQFDWEDLVPQFFGQKKGDKQKQTQK